MRDFWRHFRLEGWTSVPEKPWRLVPLEWAEIAEVSPEWVPDAYLDFDPRPSPYLIHEFPFVRGGDGGYRFVAEDPLGEGRLECGIHVRELLETLGDGDYPADPHVPGGILVGSGCGDAGRGGIQSQTCHVSRWMVHWTVCRHGEWIDLFFERNAYERGLVAMLRDFALADPLPPVPCLAGFTSLGDYRKLLKAALGRAPRFRRIWQETAADSR